MELKVDTYQSAVNNLALIFENEDSYIKIGPRGLQTKELAEPLHLTITNPDQDNVLVGGAFAHNVDYLYKELEWYLRGRKDTEFIAQYAKFWNQISIDGEANSAYGRWIFNEGVNQWKRTYELLKEDPASRKAVIYLGDRNNFNMKDTICTNNMQFRIIDGRLNMYVNMRSNDFFWGFRNDTFMFTIMQQFMAELLDVEMGTYHLFCPSFHLYEKDWKRLDSLISENYPKINTTFGMTYDIERVMRGFTTSEALHEIVHNVYGRTNELTDQEEKVISDKYASFYE